MKILLYYIKYNNKMLRKTLNTHTRTATATSPRTATAKTATGRAASPRATAFSTAVAAKDNNLFHNLPEDIQIEIMEMVKEKRKNSREKNKLYKRIYNNRQVFIDWLDEIKRDGVDDKNRVRNPLHEGTYIYTDKNGLYSKLWHLCVSIFQGNYNFRGIPKPIKIDYKRNKTSQVQRIFYKLFPQLKYFYKPQ
jgi:hypothetical protein